MLSHIRQWSEAAVLLVSYCSKQGCLTYGPRAIIRLAVRFHPALRGLLTRHCTTWEIFWISCQADWRFPAKVWRFQKTHWHHEAAEWSVSSWSHTGAAVKYQTELTDIQNDGDLKRAFSEQDLLSFDSAVIIIYRLFFLFHQTVAPICCRMPRISLLCLVEPTAASNCFREWKTQKRNQGLCLQMNIWQHHSVFQLLLLEQTQINNVQTKTMPNFTLS